MPRRPVSPYVRAQALALLDVGIEMKVIEERTGLNCCTIQRIHKKAKKHGYDTSTNYVFQKAWSVDAPRSRQRTKWNNCTIKQLMDQIEGNHYSRKMNTKALGRELGVLHMTV